MATEFEHTISVLYPIATALDVVARDDEPMAIDVAAVHAAVSPIAIDCVADASMELEYPMLMPDAAAHDAKYPATASPCAAVQDDCKPTVSAPAPVATAPSYASAMALAVFAATLHPMAILPVAAAVVGPVAPTAMLPSPVADAPRPMAMLATPDAVDGAPTVSIAMPSVKVSDATFCIS
jgi:hypothetical protein